jgi:hypothetical protein
MEPILLCANRRGGHHPRHRHGTWVLSAPWGGHTLSEILSVMGHASIRDTGSIARPQATREERKFRPDIKELRAIAYFSTFTRAWELAIGGLLVLIEPFLVRLDRRSGPIIS